MEERLEGDEKDYKHVLSDNTSLCLPCGVTDGFIIKCVLLHKLGSLSWSKVC